MSMKNIGGPSNTPDNPLPEVPTSQPSTEQKKTNVVGQGKLLPSKAASKGVSISIHRSKIPSPEVTSSNALPTEKVPSEVKAQLGTLKNQPETKATSDWEDWEWDEKDSPRAELVNQYVETLLESIKDGNKTLNRFLIDHAMKEGVNIHEVISRLESKFSDNPDIKARVDAIKQSLKVKKEVIGKDEAGNDVVKFIYGWKVKPN